MLNSPDLGAGFSKAAAATEAEVEGLAPEDAALLVSSGLGRRRGRGLVDRRG